MRTALLVGTLAVVLGTLAFAGIQSAAAQTETPRAPFAGRGPGGGVLEPYEDIIHEKIAAALGISLEEFEAARNAGATLYELAEKYGVDFDVVRQAMVEGRAEAIKQAVADGVITQAQADWMLQRSGGQGFRQGRGHGACNGTGPIGQGPFGRGRMNQAPQNES